MHEYEEQSKNLILVFRSSKPVSVEKIGLLLSYLHDGEVLDFLPGSFLVSSNASTLVIPDNIKGQSNTVKIDVFVDNSLAKLSTRELHYVHGLIEGFFLADNNESHSRHTTSR